MSQCQKVGVYGPDCSSLFLFHLTTRALLVSNYLINYFPDFSFKLAGTVRLVPKDTKHHVTQTALFSHLQTSHRCPILHHPASLPVKDLETDSLDRAWVHAYVLTCFLGLLLLVMRKVE